MRAFRIVPLLLLAFCASAAKKDAAPLRVLVYNIHAGKDAKGVDNLERVANLVTSLNADLVFLQEVDRKTTRSGNVDQVDVLTMLTGRHGVFGKSLDYQGGEYGIAILSRWPISVAEIVPLHTDPPQPRAGGSLEPRIALVANVDAPQGRFTVLNTHLDASKEDTYRLQEVEDVLAAMKRNSKTLQLTAGDFNSTPDSGVHARMMTSGLNDSWIDCGSGPELTYPADVPVKHIDYLYVAKPWRCQSAKVIETQASDHRPVFVTISR